MLIDNALNAHNILPSFYRELTFLMNTDPVIKQKMKQTFVNSTRKTEELLQRYQNILAINNIDAASILITHLTGQFVHFLKYDAPEMDENILIDEFIILLMRYSGMKAVN